MRRWRGIEDEILWKGSLLAEETGIWHIVSALVPRVRFPEKPGAEVPHAGLIEGASGETVVPTSIC